MNSAKTEIVREIDRSEYRKGKSILRWERYTHLNDGSKTGVNIGMDGNVFQHQLITKRLIKKYGAYDYNKGIININEFFQLQVTGLIHDLAEYIDGDITGDLKHTQSKEREKQSWNITVLKVLKGNVLNVKKIDYAFQIDTNTEHVLYELFKVYEKLGYLYGAMIAYKNTNTENPYLHWLCHNVIANQLSTLISKKHIYPSIENFLKDHKELIDKIIGVGSSHKDRIEEKNIDFHSALFNWNNP